MDRWTDGLMNFSFLSPYCGNEVSAVQGSLFGLGICPFHNIYPDIYTFHDLYPFHDIYLFHGIYPFHDIYPFHYIYCLSLLWYLSFQ